MKAALSLKRLDSLIINKKPGDLSRKDEIECQSKNLDNISYIKLSLADEKAVNRKKVIIQVINNTVQLCCHIVVANTSIAVRSKVLWDKIRATFIGRGEDQKIDASNELNNNVIKNGETVGDYIARAQEYQQSVPP
ncbi:RBR-type E3 ubiquitin transferase [Trichonephila clavipes]|nr:RBR-type E3 ubiquitin transferase [Trichonephila clavipes]